MTRPPLIRPGMRAHLAASGRLLWLALRHAVVALRLAVGHLIATALAVVILFEEWGWKPLAALLGQLARLKPFAALENLIRTLPPYAALTVFALPSLLLLPLKLLAIYLIAQGYKLAAAGLFIGAKIVGTALVARIFMLTQATLMRIGWFKRLYDWAMPLKAALLAWARDSAVWRAASTLKERVKVATAPLVARAKAAASAIRERLFGSGGQRG